MMMEQAELFQCLPCRPDRAAYLALKKICLGTCFDEAAALRGFERSDFHVHAIERGMLQGFAQIMSDGGLWYCLTELYVLPDHPFADVVCETMVKDLLKQFHRAAPPGGYMLAISADIEPLKRAGLQELSAPERAYMVHQTAARSSIAKPDQDLGEGFEVVSEMVDVETFLKFRAIGKLGKKDPEAAEISLKRTSHALQVRHRGECVGFCRTLTDGGLWYQIVDGVVLPDYQASGVGTFLVRQLVYDFHQRAPLGASLLTVTWARSFALKTGFQDLHQDVVGLWAWQPT